MILGEEGMGRHPRLFSLTLGTRVICGLSMYTHIDLPQFSDADWCQFVLLVHAKRWKALTTCSTARD